MTFYQGLRIKTRPQLKKNGKLKRKHYILIALQNPHINFLGRIIHMEVVGQEVA